MIYNRPECWLAKTKTVVPYLTFSSPSSFTLAVSDSTKHWDGTLEYSTDTSTWSTWDGTTSLSSAISGSDNVLYLRGIGNTKFSYVGKKGPIPWAINGTDVRCDGNIETLLDYATVEAGQHPVMAEACFAGLFFGCMALITPPELPATTLAGGCYMGMFRYCTSLTQAPTLPAITLANSCYYSMFQGCTSLTQAPTLPAITLANSCYYSMFSECTSLTQAPELPAITLAEGCYMGMFQGCTGLTQAPALPATTLANDCYASMFSECTSLTQIPKLPAITLAEGCYMQMFNICSKIKLSSTQTEEYTQEYRIPTTGTGTTATNALDIMFASTGGTFTGTPVINTTYYLSNTNTVV